jgi:hypothetical protein
MATWSTQASTDLNNFVTKYNLSEAEAVQLNRDIAAWADMIGKLNTKNFTVRNYQITATVENHEVIKLDINA